MNAVPKTIKDAITSSASVMLASLNIPQTQIDGAFRAFFSELEGRGTNAITNPVPLDRVLTREQAAKILGCCKRCISRKVADGKLRAVYGGRDGKRITGVVESSLRAFMEGRSA